MSRVLVLNIEQGMPTVEEARQRLLAELKQAKKIIHGYGSSGKGGELRIALRNSLRYRKKEGIVTCVVFGEKWTVPEPEALYALEHCPALKSDRDLGRYNQGITIAMLV